MDDDGRTIPAIIVSDTRVTEGGAGSVAAVFTVALSVASTDPVTVQYATSDGTAQASIDYIATSLSTLTFAPGEVTKTISVSVNGDLIIEQDETFFLNLTNPVNATLADSQGQGTVLNDDFGAPANLTISVDGKRATFVDTDGDAVIAQITKGHWARENFVFDAQGGLTRLDLGTSFAGISSFSKTELSVVATTPSGGHGDGFVAIGELNAAGANLRSVEIDGALGAINLGAGKKTETAARSLLIESLGTVDDVLAESTIGGTLGRLRTKGAIEGTLTINGGPLSVGKIALGSLGGLLLASGDVGNVQVFGNISAVDGSDHPVGIRVAGNIAALTVSGSISGTIDSAAVISAAGAIGHAALNATRAIGYVKVGGNVSDAQILAGYRGDGMPLNADASIGRVIVMGNWSASSLVAGMVDSTGDGFGRNDTIFPEPAADAILARIGKIIIQGAATGSDGFGDHFGITAQQIGKARIGFAKLLLTQGADNLLLDSQRADFRLVDFA